jgi:GNAT superfamily N-acetyltransferase
MAIVIRTAERHDIPDLIRVHVDAWRVAYRGVIDDGYLQSSLIEEQRTAMWNAWTWPDGPGQHLFVGEVDGRVLGFGLVGPERVEPEGTVSGLGEVYSFYLHPDSWGSGLATPLMEQCHDFLHAGGFSHAVLWVLRDNPRARRFYEKMGWSATGKEASFTGPQTGAALPYAVAELQYGVVLG